MDIAFSPVGANQPPGHPIGYTCRGGPKPGIPAWIDPVRGAGAGGKFPSARVRTATPAGPEMQLPQGHRHA
ncbi:hypothetical protein GCM10022380_50630 [Amycolatopsis tucumanensis]|uniref:Uncharacterized protein n=1 Tax=Amycolatopsis tucumanensis TaxID=401106 RepID=A0ABP7ISG7_9PSEU